MSDIKKRAIRLAIILGIILTILIIYYLLVKFTSFSIPCLFHLLTNINCPCCGITRMLKLELEFNFSEAMKYNYFMFFTLPILAFIIIMGIIYYLKDIKPRKWFYIVIISYLLLLLIWWIVRNILGI